MDIKEIEENIKTSLAQKLGFSTTDLEDKRVSETINEIYFIIIRGAWIKIFELLSETKQKELAQILEDNPDDKNKTESFLKKELPNYQEIMKLEVETYIKKFVLNKD